MHPTFQQNWTWPEKPDVLHYRTSDSVHFISHPLPIGHREYKMSLSGEAVLYASSPCDKRAQESAKRERRRRKIIKELFDTEKEYLHRLELVHKFFDFPLRFACLVPDDVHARLFSNMEQIHEVNATLLEQMEQSTVGQAFSQLGPYLKLYSTYANNHQYALTTLQEWRGKRSDFAEFLTRQEERPEVKGLKLNALLITPVQRIPRYKMLLEDLLGHTPVDHHDYLKLKEATEKIADIALHINEHIRQNENFMKMLTIQRSFDSSAPKLLAPGRQFVKEGPLKKVSRKGGKSHERMFFLFSDILLYGKPKFLDGGGKSYTCSCVLPLRHCTVEPVFITSLSKSDTGGVFKISCKDECLVLYSADAANAKEWSEEVDRAIRKLCDDRQTLRKPSSNKIPLRGRSLRRHRAQQKKTDIKIHGKTPMRPLSIISTNSEEDGDSDCSPRIKARLEPVRQHFKLVYNSSLSKCGFEEGEEQGETSESVSDSPVMRKRRRGEVISTSSDEANNNGFASNNTGISLSDTSDSFYDNLSSQDSLKCLDSTQESDQNSTQHSRDLQRLSQLSDGSSQDASYRSSEKDEKQSLRQYSFSLRGSRNRVDEGYMLDQEQENPEPKKIGKGKGKKSKDIAGGAKGPLSASCVSLASTTSNAYFPPNSPAHRYHQHRTFNMRLRSYLQKPLRRFQKAKKEITQHCSPFKSQAVANRRDGNTPWDQ